MILVDGQWAPWSVWSACSKTCATLPKGIKIRQRTCTNPEQMYGGKDCLGDAEENMICNQNIPCPGTRNININVIPMVNVIHLMRIQQVFIIIIISECFLVNTTSKGNSVTRGWYKNVNTAKECQTKCQKNSQCEYFHVLKQGQYKGCWLKTANAKNIIKSDINGIFGPKHCKGI